MEQIGLAEALGLWWSGHQIQDYELWFLPVIWWARIAKVLGFISGCVILVDIVGVERIAEYGKRLGAPNRAAVSRFTVFLGVSAYCLVCLVAAWGAISLLLRGSARYVWPLGTNEREREYLKEHPELWGGDDLDPYDGDGFGPEVTFEPWWLNFVVFAAIVAALVVGRLAYALVHESRIISRRPLPAARTRACAQPPPSPAGDTHGELCTAAAQLRHGPARVLSREPEPEPEVGGAGWHRPGAYNSSSQTWAVRSWPKTCSSSDEASRNPAAW